MNSLSNVDLVFCVALAAVAFYATAHLIVGIALRIGKSPEYRYKLLPTAALATLLNGWIMYFVAFSMVGSDGSVFSVLVRSFLASIGMFVGGSFFQELGGLTANGIYMFLLAFLQVVALLITAIFAVRMLSKRFESYMRTFHYTLFPRKRTLNVFIGLNPSSIGFLQSQKSASNEKCHNVIVDLPSEGSQESFTVSLETIFGFFPYKMEYIKLLKGVKYVLLNADKNPSLLTSAPDANILENIDLGDLRTLVYCHEKVRMFFFDSDNESNVRAATQLMADKVFEGKNIEVYVSADESEENLIIADHCGWSLVDPATLAVRMLRTDAQAQPINYLPRSVEEIQSGSVQEPFEALVVGFGHTGREALSFLYETAAFPNAQHKRAPFMCHVVDYEIDARRGDWYRDHATMQGDIVFEPLSDRCNGYWEWLSSIVARLNYVVVATGNDEANIRIAVSLLRLWLKETGGKNNVMPGIYLLLRAPQSTHMLEAIADGYGDYGKMLHPFGEDSQIYSYENIIIDKALQGGLMFNEAYSRLSARLEGTVSAAVPQQVLSLNDLYAHRSAARQNLRNYLHGLTKLQLIGLDEEKVKQALACRRDNKSLDADQERMVQVFDSVIGYAESHNGTYPTNPSADPIEVLLCNVAVCEHLRWNAAMELQGYTYGAEKDHLRRTHPCLTDWDNLTYEKQAYDFLALETVFNMIDSEAAVVRQQTKQKE